MMKYGEQPRRDAVPSPKYTPPAPPAHKQRRCTVDGRQARFHGFYERALTVQPEQARPTDRGGEVAYPVAVVEYECGQVEVVPAEMVRFRPDSWDDGPAGEIQR